VNYPPMDCDLTYTLFHAEEDAGMRALVERFASIDVPNVTWDLCMANRHFLSFRIMKVSLSCCQLNTPCLTSLWMNSGALISILRFSTATR